jgi:DtxR family Mn-dependent transcriptional regulator
MSLSQTEENYLKAIFKLSGREHAIVSTSAIAEEMQTAAASVTDMLKRLTEKKYVLYVKYKGARLSEDGRAVAIDLIRKHRLWETFMVEKLNFSWDEVHVVAEQLEHIQSTKLIEQLERFLDYPKVDPHGDPIPDRHGNFEQRSPTSLADLSKGQQATIVAVQEDSSDFLRYLQQCELVLGAEVEILEVYAYDQSRQIRINGQQLHTITLKVAQNLYIKR